MTSNIPPQPPITQADLDAHSEQALIELVYVRTANEILGSAMGSLESALNVSQSVLNILQALQNIKNYITVSSPGTFNFNYTFAANGRITTLAGGSLIDTNFSLADYQSMYASAASAYFGQLITPSVHYPTGKTPAQAQDDFNILYTNLSAMIIRLSAISPAGSDTDPGTLLFQLHQIKTDMLGSAASPGANLEDWILDSYDLINQGSSSDAGKLQSNLTTAITAAQSLNDSQKEDVRRFLFIFQEYYQSASAVLSKITQIIEKMAQKISQ